MSKTETQTPAPMPEIGSNVTYIRHSAAEGVIEGTGKLKAVGLDGENRKVALIQENSRTDQAGNLENFNVPAACVNPSAEFVARFNELVTNVKQVEGEANAAIRKLTTDANNEIGRLHDELLGSPVDMTASPVDPKPAEGEGAAGADPKTLN